MTYGEFIDEDIPAKYGVGFGSDSYDLSLNIFRGTYDPYLIAWIQGKEGVKHLGSFAWKYDPEELAKALYERLQNQRIIESIKVTQNHDGSIDLISNIENFQDKLIENGFDQALKLHLENKEAGIELFKKFLPEKEAIKEFILKLQEMNWEED